jgi:rubredoxin
VLCGSLKKTRFEGDQRRRGVDEREIHVRTEAATMAMWRCTICGYIYDPETGNSNQNVEPGTPFEELPPAWVCPICGVPREEFEEIEE